jgi:hypothetical protein
VVIGVREDGQKVMLAVKNMGSAKLVFTTISEIPLFGLRSCNTKEAGSSPDWANPRREPSTRFGLATGH